MKNHLPDFYGGEGEYRNLKRGRKVKSGDYAWKHTNDWQGYGIFILGVTCIMVHRAHDQLCLYSCTTFDQTNLV